jgi:alpha-ketoglutarate-dependent 2,4-dichlorophenoxyacetate dioxygenase
VAAIEAGMDRYAVLVFHDQNITDEQQIAFSRDFGGIENSAGGTVTKTPDKRLHPLMNDVSNLGKDHKPLGRDDRTRLFNLGNQLWHSDSSFRAIPAKYSILSGRIVVDTGGNTEFADMRAAYDALDDATKALCEGLVCEHSLMYSRGSMGFPEFTEEECAMFRPVRQALVRTHPKSGRRSLYLGGARLSAPPQRGGDAPRKRLCPQMAAVRPGNVGQPPDHASGAPLRRDQGARHAPDHRGRRRADRGTGCRLRE